MTHPSRSASSADEQFLSSRHSWVLALRALRAQVPDDLRASFDGRVDELERSALALRDRARSLHEQLRDALVQWSYTLFVIECAQREWLLSEYEPSDVTLRVAQELAPTVTAIAETERALSAILEIAQSARLHPLTGVVRRAAAAFDEVLHHFGLIEGMSRLIALRVQEAEVLLADAAQQRGIEPESLSPLGS